MCVCACVCVCVCVSDARMTVISVGAADNPRVGSVG